MFDSCGRPSDFSVISTPCLRSATKARAVSSSMARRIQFRTRAAGHRSAMRAASDRSRHAPAARQVPTPPIVAARKPPAKASPAPVVSTTPSTATTGTCSSLPSDRRSTIGRAPSLTTSNGGRWDDDQRRPRRASPARRRAPARRAARRTGRRRMRSTTADGRHVDAEAGAGASRPCRRTRRVLAPIGSAHSEYAGTCIHVIPSTHAASTGRQLLGGAAVGQHRPLAIGLDEDDDRAGRARRAARARPRRRPPTAQRAARRWRRRRHVRRSGPGSRRAQPRRRRWRRCHPPTGRSRAGVSGAPSRRPSPPARRRLRRGRRPRTARPPCSTCSQRVQWGCGR